MTQRWRPLPFEYEKEVRVIIDRTGRDPFPELVHSGIVVPIGASRLLRSIVIAVGAALRYQGAGAALEAGDRSDLTSPVSALPSS
jgi:hypothetical protein